MIKLGEMVNCSAYLKPVRDGVFIEKIEGKLTESGEDVYVLHPKIVSEVNTVDAVMSGNQVRPWHTDLVYDKNIPGELLSPREGAYDLEKTYYERKEKRFRGIVVGVKDVVTEGYLGVDTDTDWMGREHQRIFKEPKTTVKCALVFYSMGRSRLVPLDDLYIDYEMIYEPGKWVTMSKSTEEPKNEHE